MQPKALNLIPLFLAGLEEGLLPSSRSLAMKKQLKKNADYSMLASLVRKSGFCSAYSRYRYNYGTMTDQRPSRFVQEIPSGTVPVFDASYWNTLQQSQFFSNWLAPNGANQNESLFLDSRKRSLETNGTKSLVKASIINSESKMPHGIYKKNQPVSHEKFGLGLIQDIELRANGITYLQVKFKSGIKKLDASFLKPT